MRATSLDLLDLYDDLELMGRGNMLQPDVETREILLGYLDGKPDFQPLSSYLLSGRTSSGKSHVGAHLCSMAVLAWGLLCVIDPHGNNPNRGLLAKIAPLRKWFFNDPYALDFDEGLEGVVADIERAYKEYRRRKGKNGMKGPIFPLFLVIDELNELLGKMKDQLGANKATHVGQIVANFARGGGKYGCYAILLGHNWQVNKSGGSDVRPNVRGRIALSTESMLLALGKEKEELKRRHLLDHPLRPGSGMALVVRPTDDTPCLMRFPMTTRDDCAAIAQLRNFIETGNWSELSEISGQNEPMQLVLALPEISDTSETLARPKELVEPIQGSKSFSSHAPNPPNLLETYLIYLTTTLNIKKISLEDIQKVFAEGNKQIQQQQYVERTKIQKALDWNTYKYQRIIMPLCDLLGWDRSMNKRHLTTEQWQEIKEKYDFTCPDCDRREPEIVLTRDHIIPKAKGGSDEPSNIAPRCLSCNSSKRETTKLT
jgi:hypothetical protein